MKRSIICVVLFFIILTSCTSDDVKLNLDIPDISQDDKHIIHTEDLIKVPYEGELPEQTMLYMNTNEVTILKRISLPNENLSAYEFEIDLNYGVSEGKLVYRTKKSTFTYWYGFMNYDFSFVTEPIYDEVYPYEYECAVVMIDGLFGVINSEGETILLCGFENKPVIYKNFISYQSRDGNQMSEFNYYNSSDGEYLFSLIKEYNTISETFSYRKIFSDETVEEVYELNEYMETGLIPYMDSNNKLWGYKNEFGDIIVAPIYDRGFQFSDGYARVLKNNMYGYIDKAGKLEIPVAFKMAYDFKNGIARIHDDSGNKYINNYGILDMNYEFVNIKDFNDGLAAVMRIGNTKWEYIDINGKRVFNGLFSEAGDFINGHAMVKTRLPSNHKHYTNYNYYFINKHGEQVPPNIRFSKAINFSLDGFAIGFLEGSTPFESGGVEGFASTLEYYLIKGNN